MRPLISSANSSSILYEPVLCAQLDFRANHLQSFDQTNGHVQYVNQSVATTERFVRSSSESVYIGPDLNRLFPRGGPGRPSVRIVSTNTYTHGLFLLDLTHMPAGCGVWPAFWTDGDNWPNNGEIGRYFHKGWENRVADTFRHYRGHQPKRTGFNVAAHKQRLHLCGAESDGNSRVQRLLCVRRRLHRVRSCWRIWQLWLAFQF